VILLAILLACLAGGAGILHATDVIPPRPTRYFNDAAGIVFASGSRPDQSTLEQFERGHVEPDRGGNLSEPAIDSSVEDYTVRVAQSWGVGQKGKNNGAVFVRLHEGTPAPHRASYGLEAVLPDGAVTP